MSATSRPSWWHARHMSCARSRCGVARLPAGRVRIAADAADLDGSRRRSSARLDRGRRRSWRCRGARRCRGTRASREATSRPDADRAGWRPAASGSARGGSLRRSSSRGSDGTSAGSACGLDRVAAEEVVAMDEVGVDALGELDLDLASTRCARGSRCRRSARGTARRWRRRRAPSAPCSRTKLPWCENIDTGLSG